MEGSLVFFLSLLLLWSTAAAGSCSSPAAASPVRVGVVLDLRSDVGRERRACISEALHDFNLKHPTARVELLVRDSFGDLATSTHAAEDMINNSQVQAIIWSSETLTEADHIWHLGHNHKHIPVIAFSSISPTSCAFWLEDPVTPSGDHPKFGFTLGSDSITFLNSETDRTQNKKPDTRRKLQDCSNEKKLIVAVPKKNGFQVFVNVTVDPTSKKKNITGYSIDIFEAAMENLQPRLCYEFIVFNDTYDELVRNVYLGVYDAAVGDVTITAERASKTDFTMPYTPSGVYMLVLAEDEPNTISWTFVKPLNKWLWLATVVFFFYTGFVVWMIELPRNQEYQGSMLRQCSTALYFSFSTLTFSQGQIIRSPLSKIVVVIWCFVVLILVQSYTASLSSMLTAKRLRPFVKDLDQLQRSGDFVGYQDDSFVGTLLMNHNISGSRLKKYSTKEEYADALRRGSKYGGVSAIVDEIPYITSFLSDDRYKDDFMMLGSIYTTPGFGFAFHHGSPLVQNLSIAILNLGGGNGSQIEEKWFGTSSPPTAVPDTDSGPLTFQSFSGLFLITGSISSLMLLISIARWVYAKYAGLRKADMESISFTDVDEDWSLLQNGMGNNPSPDQHPLGEAGNENLPGIHVNGENAREGAPGIVQNNGMHGDSVRAEHIQIEMSTT